jgi:hypothetical protein
MGCGGRRITGTLFGTKEVFYMTTIKMMVEKQEGDILPRE